MFTFNFHKFAFIKCVCSTFKNIVRQFIPFDNLTCTNHNLLNMFVNNVCNIFNLFVYKSCNSILSKGKKLNTTNLIKLAANTYDIQCSKEKRILQKNNINYV